MKREVIHKDEFTKQEFFICACGDWRDHIVVEYDRTDWGSKMPEENRLNDTLHFHVQMNHYLPWYKRVWRSLQYVFAKDAKWCHWSETLVSKTDAIRMRELLTEFIESPHSHD